MKKIPKSVIESVLEMKRQEKSYKAIALNHKISESSVRTIILKSGFYKKLNLEAGRKKVLSKKEEIKLVNKFANGQLETSTNGK